MATQLFISSFIFHYAIDACTYDVEESYLMQVKD